jgi:hypothetical protein
MMRDVSFIHTNLISVGQSQCLHTDIVTDQRVPVDKVSFLVCGVAQGVAVVDLDLTSGAENL